MKFVPTYEVSLYIGSVRGYNGKSFHESDLADAIADFQTSKGEDAMCVRITPTRYVIRDYNERGWAVSCINYPRFPKEGKEIEKFMLELAEYLLNKFEQNRITVVGKYTSIMLEREGAEVHPEVKK
jgi:hypothetical protein